MSKQLIPLITFLISIFPAFGNGESLRIIDEMILSADKIKYIGQKDIGNRELYVGGIYLSSETTFVSSNFGLLAKFSKDEPWEKILDREPWGNNWWEDFKKAQKKNVIFSFGDIWRISETDEIVVFDSYMGSLYTINLLNRNSISAKIWKKKAEKFHLNKISICNELIFYGIGSSYHDSILAISHTDIFDFHMVFECPPELKRKLDSVWADPNCFPAFNPIDSTIWLAFMFYNYLYIIDLKGNLLDSVKITASDFRLPQPPVSRIKSNAVAQDWLSKCTPVSKFRFVSAGYFILQFKIGWEELEADKIPLYSTLMWNANRQPVEIEIDQHWRIAGVQPDGRIIFAHYLIEGDKREIVLNVTRIVP